VDIYFFIYLLHRELHVSALGKAIFRMYTKHLISSYTKQIYGLLIWGRERVKWARDLVSVLKVGWCGLHGVSIM